MLYYEGENTRLYCGDVRAVLRGLPAKSVQTVITSPPYWGLRAYGTDPQVWGGDPSCDHTLVGGQFGNAWKALPFTGSVAGNKTPSGFQQKSAAALSGSLSQLHGHPGGGGAVCTRCGAWRGELGSEPTPALYVAHLVEVFQDVWRVLDDRGTLWLNIGDSHAGSGRGPSGHNGIGNQERRQGFVDPGAIVPQGMKPKDLVGVPWMLAFALRADGWYLRQDIIWAKPNPMPESVRDRCTRSHEYLFLLTKSSRYYYDAAAIKEPAKLQTVKMPDGWDTRPGAHGQHGWQGRQKGKPNAATVVGRNKRDVWTITTRGYPGAHFATFPPKLVEPCVLAGCPPTGVVLDPFAGSGTVLQVARDHGRQGWGIELNAGYCALAVDRLEGVKGATA